MITGRKAEGQRDRADDPVGGGGAHHFGTFTSLALGLPSAPVGLDWKEVGEIEHVFTHFSLTLKVWVAEGEAVDLVWSPLSDLEALPSVFLKARLDLLLPASAVSLCARLSISRDCSPFEAAKST